MCLSRHLLHHCFQAVMDHGTQTAHSLAETYRQRCYSASSLPAVHHDSFEYLISVGISLGESPPATPFLLASPCVRGSAWAPLFHEQTLDFPVLTEKRRQTSTGVKNRKSVKTEKRRFTKVFAPAKIFLFLFF